MEKEPKKAELDLGQADVHAPSSVKPTSYKADDDEETTDLAFPPAADDDDDEEGEEGEKPAPPKAKKPAKGSPPPPPKKAKVAATHRPDSLPLKSDDAGEPAKPVWIQVARQGSFKGHAAGPFELGAKEFAEIIRNFEATQNKRVPVDFEHASEMSASEGAIPTHGAPAQGWITQLTVRPDGNLWGLVQWGNLARSYIREGRYMFLSPAIVFGSRDRVTGKGIGARLSSAALTNQPFLDGMAPLAARHRENGVAAVPTGDLLEAVRDALELPDYAGAEQMLAALRVVESSPAREREHGHQRYPFAQRLRDALRLPLTTPDPEVFVEARCALGEIRPPTPSPAAPAAINTPVTASTNEETIMDENKAKELQGSNDALTLKLTAAEATLAQLRATSETELKTLRDENAALKVKIEAHEGEKLKDRVDLAIASYQHMGLTEKLRPVLARQAKNDPEGFDLQYPAVPPAQRHLATTIAAGPHHVPAPKIADVVPISRKAAGDIASVEERAERELAKAMKAGAPISREEAFSRAHMWRAKKVTKLAQKNFAGGQGG